jgi:hypothetical protein
VDATDVVRQQVFEGQGDLPPAAATPANPKHVG